MEGQVQLQSEDGAVFNISRRALKQSRMLSTIFNENINPQEVIKLQTVTAPVLTKVIEYLSAHEEDDSISSIEVEGSSNHAENRIPRILRQADRHPDLSDDDSVNGEAEEGGRSFVPETDIYHNRYSGLLCAFDNKFLQSLSVPTLLEVTKAANYLGIDNLLDLGCRGIASHMKGLSTEAIRQKFNIKCDFTPEEEERIRREGLWAQDF